MKGRRKGAREEGQVRVKGAAEGGAKEGGGRKSERGAGESEAKVVELERQHSGRVKGG